MGVGWGRTRGGHPGDCGPGPWFPSESRARRPRVNCGRPVMVAACHSPPTGLRERACPGVLLCHCHTAPKETGPCLSQTLLGAGGLGEALSPVGLPPRCSLCHQFPRRGPTDAARPPGLGLSVYEGFQSDARCPNQGHFLQTYERVSTPNRLLFWGPVSMRHGTHNEEVTRGDTACWSAVTKGGPRARAPPPP